jgi:medium-chain acyl-[acyl-carrier-protein] hydrolase
MDGLTTSAPRMTPSPWQVRWRPVPAATVRLLCLPHAGGGAGAYRTWAESLADHGVEVVAIRLPGRETRFHERPYTRLPELVAALIDDLRPVFDQPYAWFGHSMGALVAFEACRLARRLGLPSPDRLLVSGRPAPHLVPRESRVHNAPVPRFLARLREMNGTPPELLNDPGALASLLPTLRADFAIAETYQYRTGPPLEVPISAFGGASDVFANAEELRGWGQHSTAGCTVRVLDGGHFFLHDFHRRLLPLVAVDLRSPTPMHPHRRQQ